MTDLDLGLIGNCGIAALVDRRARIVWYCLPRFDGDPIFHSLLGGPPDAPDGGQFAIELDGEGESEQSYVANTAILKTVLKGNGGAIEVTDFAPRFYWRERPFRPKMLLRRVAPVSGNPRIRVRMRPRFDYGANAPAIAHGSNHIRYAGNGTSLRLTTDAPVDYVLAETRFRLDEPLHFVLGPDETLSVSPLETLANYEQRTRHYWQSWTRRLALPFDWQEAVTRAAITLKLCAYEPTGAIVAAMTTSIPEAANSGRNWDYRYCWIRDAFFVVRALNSLAAVRTMENYFRWIMNVVDNTRQGTIQPVYGVALEEDITERVVDHLPGYRGMGPVRVGNQAHEHYQHDTYGHLVLGAAPVFFDTRLHMQPTQSHFEQLERVGEQAARVFDQPDAGMWELRSRQRIHTSSSLMCWAACDRLAKIARRLGLATRAARWNRRAARIRDAILENAWSDKRKSFVESFGGEHLDAGVLLMSEIGFIDPADPRFVSTVELISEVLGRGPHLLRYEEADDFGLAVNAFNICAFWRLDALAKIGRREEAREIYEALLTTRTALGLMSEDTDSQSGAPWGNFPQTYSMVGIINGATRLSRRWETIV